MIAATFLLALGVRAVIARTACTSHPVVVNVASATDIAPVVRHLGGYFNRLNRQVDGRCVRVTVTAERPGTVTAQLTGSAASPHLPPADAWIPDSGLWAGLEASRPARPGASGPPASPSPAARLSS